MECQKERIGDSLKLIGIGHKESRLRDNKTDQRKGREKKMGSASAKLFSSFPDLTAKMVNKCKSNFFKPLGNDRISTVTACVVPKDILPIQGHCNRLRKAPPYKAECTVICKVSPEQRGPNEIKLHSAFETFETFCKRRPTATSSICEGETPISFSAVGPAEAQLFLSTPTTPSDSFKHSRAVGVDECVDTTDANPSMAFVYYDCVQQAWLQHPAGQRRKV